MILTPSEYSETFLIAGRKVSTKTIIRRCNKGQLPSLHLARNIKGVNGGKGLWVIEIPGSADAQTFIHQKGELQPIK